MTRHLLCFVFLLVVSLQAHGQAIMAFAPWEFGADLAQYPDDNGTEFSFSVKRAVPLHTLLPQVTQDSYMYAIRARFGARFVDGEYDQVRFRVTALDVAMQRAFTAGGFTLLDYQRIGPLEVNATWLGASFGPGYHFDSYSFGAWIRAKASGSLNSLKTGHLIFPEFDPASELKTGLTYGFRVESGVDLRGKLLLTGTVSRDVMNVSDTQLDERSLDATLRFSDRLVFKAGYVWNRVEQNDRVRRFDGIGAGVRFTPSVGMN